MLRGVKIVVYRQLLSYVFLWFFLYIDFPVFLYCYPLTGSFDYHLIVYDVRDARYHLLQCSAVINLDYNAGLEDIFSSGLLKVDKDLAATSSMEEIKMVLVKYL